MRNDGQNYEKYINKFIKGEIVSSKNKFYDIETKTTLYEVKGCKVIQENKTGTVSLGRYQINLENHNKLFKEGEKKSKKVKYVFILRVKNQKIFKVMNWEIVNKIVMIEGKICKRKDGEKLYNVCLKNIW